MTAAASTSADRLQPELWALPPSRARVEALDLALRYRLGQSLDYIAKIVGAGENAGLRRRLAEQSVSPWMFCLYSKLVTELAKRPPGDVAELLNQLVLASSLPTDQAIVTLRDRVFSEAWWAHFEVLFDTDRRRPFRPQAPEAADISLCRREIDRGMALLEQSEPAFYDEVRSLLRLIVLGAPASADPLQGFDGGSTFFFWRGVLLNAAARRSAIEAIDVLVHESSHVLLFGLSTDEPLTNNKGDERHVSPLRSDPRPVDGIFHAAFVTTRVCLAMSRLLDGGHLNGEDAKAALRSLEYNGNAARESIALLEQQALLTERGRRIFDELRCYWDEAKPH